MGEVVLLDTNVLLRLLSDPSDVDTAALDLLANPDTQVLVSAISAFEIAQKVRIGKLQDPGILDAWTAVLQRDSLTELPLSAADLIEAGTMTWDHRDPFDRMIVAQSRRHAAVVATRDRVILDCGLVATLTA